MKRKLDLGDPKDPYSFEDLARRNPAWFAGFGGDHNDFIETIPTSPADLDDPRLDRAKDRDFGAFTSLVRIVVPVAAVLVAAVWVWLWLRG